ncbi:MAG: glycosyltransferase family 39 protein [Lachnospiraceae bacterium]|nr:glycosyltransferase family 39 protein [Lachnospiraceae bacterium]
MQILIRIYASIKREQWRLQDGHFLSFCGIFTIMVLLAFGNLGNRSMWLDEGITAQIGKNTLSYGYPRLWDGKNLSTTNNGLDIGEHFMFTKENWLPFYAAAIGELMGGGNMLLRLPFVMCGIISAIVFYLIAKLLTDNNTALISFALYAFSVPLLLYYRQVRYYAIVLLLVNLSYYFYLKAKNYSGLEKRYWILLTVSLILLFHAQYMAFLCTVLSLASYIILINRDYKNARMWICLGVIVLFTAPWFFYFTYGTMNFTPIRSNITEQLMGYVSQIHVFFIPFLPLGLFAISIKLAKSFDNKINIKSFQCLSLCKNTIAKTHIVLPIIVIICNLFVISVFTNEYNTRFLIPCVFACYLLCAILLKYITSNIHIIGKILFVLIFFTNILHISPYMAIKATDIENDKISKNVAPPLPHYGDSGHALLYDLNTYIEEQCVPRSYMLDFLFEISNDYNDAMEGLALFLNQYADAEDIVYIINRYNWHSVSYYTGLKIANRLVEYDDNEYYQSIAYKNFLKYTHLTTEDENMIDWFIFYPYGEPNNDMFLKLLSNPNLDCIEILYPEAPELPDIWAHSFWTDNSYPHIYVFRNKLTKGHIPLPVNKFTIEEGKNAT